MKAASRHKPQISKKDDLRQQRCSSIVQTASKLFANYGYDECDMDCVAEQLKIAKGTLYLYFKGKQQLFFACVDMAMKELHAAIVNAQTASDDPLLRISNAIRAYVVFFSKHPEYVELMVLERAIFRNRKHATYFKYREKNRDYWRGLYDQLIKKGVIKTALKTEALLDMIGNLVYGTMFTNHFQGRRVSIAQQHRALMTFAFSGLLAPEQLRKVLR